MTRGQNVREGSKPGVDLGRLVCPKDCSAGGVGRWARPVRWNPGERGASQRISGKACRGGIES